MNLKTLLKPMKYEERIELITNQIKEYEDLKLETTDKISLSYIDLDIDYYKKVLETIKIWKDK